MKVKRIAILGSTGSIGTQTLDIVRQHPDKLQVAGLVANCNSGLLKEQAAEFNCGRVALMDTRIAASVGLAGGMAAIEDIATSTEVDLVVVAVAGVIGLVPTLAAIKAGKPEMCYSRFDIAAYLTEIILLGDIALRVGQKLEWDGPGMKATNAPEADQYLNGKPYRAGWELPV